MYQHNIFTIEPYKLQVRNLEGCVKQLINFTEIEGSITMTAQCGNYMACLTDQNKIRVFDLSRREIKSTNITKSLTKLIICKLLNYISQNTSTYNHSITPLQETITLLHNSDNLFINELNISWISINNSGNSIAFTIEILYNGELCKLLWLNSMDSLRKIQLDKANDKVMERTINGIMNKEENLLKKWFPDPNIYIYHIDEDKLKCFNFFETLTNSIHDIPRTINNPESDNHSVNLNLIRLNSTNLIDRRWPKHHYWDQYESRMLVVEAAPISPDHPILKSKLNVLEKVNNEHSGINYRIDNDTDQCTTVDNRSSSKRKSKVSTSIVSLFISPDRNDTIIQGSFLMSFHHSALIGVEVPFIYFSVRCDLNHLILDEQYRNRCEKITSNRPIINKIDCTSTITSNHNNGLDLNTSLHREDEELNDNDDINNHSRRKSMNSEVNDGDESTTQNRVHYIDRCVMQNFIGLEDADEKTREAMLNFSYYLALGEMDSAFRAMKLIKSPVVWQIFDKKLLDLIKFEVNNPESDNHSVNLNLIRLNSTNLIDRRWPKHHYWDQYESRMLVVEAAPISPDHPILKSKLNVLEKVNNEHSGINYRIDNDTDQCTTVDNRSSSKRKSKVSTSIVSLFISPDRNDTIIQGSFLMSFHHSALIGVEVPFIYFSVRCDLNHLILDEQYRNRCEKITSNRPIINKIDCTSTITSNHNNGLDLNTSLHREDEELNDNDDINNHSRRKSMNSEVNDGDESTTQNRVHYIDRCVMQNFIGLEDADEKTREAMLNFSYYLALGEMDSAFRAMKLIKSPVVWQNMAKMCVTTCRLDVARVCLGKINNPMGSKMLREFKSKEPELEAQAGELALQIGMTEEAEQLFIQCNRWDLVIRLHQSLGNWNKALITAEQHNRMLLRSIHYAYAKELESVGNIQQAIEHYIKSGTYQFEVPRMLQNNPELLESFVNKQNDQNIKSWWAKTLEAQGRLEEAKTYYSNSKDYLSLVRVLCCLGEESEAETICNETDDPGACHHLGNHLKLKGCIDQAIQDIFNISHIVIFLFKYFLQEHNRNDHLFSLAQLGRSDDILESAKHLENYPDYIDKAVLLYHKAGKINRAIELAINNHQFDALQTIISSLNDEQLDSVMLKECSEFFIQNNQFDRAVEILAAGKQYLEAIQLCNEYDIPITEDLIEKLTPITNHLSNHDLSNIFIKLGELCLINEYYYLACKKFTQAGNYISAIKSLIKSGDIEKIIFFTNISKQKEIYIITANYLQTINNWHKNINIIRNIIQFYIRGQAMESLITFYETCAHSEIEESGNYEKALDALTEAYKVLVKLSSSTINDDNNQTNECHLKKRLTQIKKKTILCNEFIEIQKAFVYQHPIHYFIDHKNRDHYLTQTELQYAMQRCYTLLENIGQDDILRPGDIYSLIIRGLVMEEKYKAALTCLNEMKERIGDNIIFRYLDHEILDKIYKTLNLTSIEYDKHTSDKITIENDALDTPTYEGNATDGDVSDETNDC
ncbi:intraflagellar transport protein 140 [Schistosoma bovis]|uniref:Intraflagellar transport protein 140 n=1 Tax=Schistosoma bovis TaxID=6184 RepID=A0A430QD62_SCHBO|nr:intraflagellar transport protein 140 [Schistosoma bovis]